LRGVGLGNLEENMETLSNFLDLFGGIAGSVPKWFGFQFLVWFLGFPLPVTCFTALNAFTINRNVT